MRVYSDESLDMPILTAFQRLAVLSIFGSDGNQAEPDWSSLRHTLRATAMDDSRLSRLSSRARLEMADSLCHLMGWLKAV
jgi:hypothetical protein